MSNRNDESLLRKFENNLQEYSKSEEAAKFYLDLATNQQHAKISDVAYDRLFWLFLEDHKLIAREYAIEAIYKLKRTNFNETHLTALEIALKTERSERIREYAIQIIDNLITSNEEKTIIDEKLKIDQTFFNTISESISDSSQLVQYYVVFIIMKLLKLNIEKNSTYNYELQPTVIDYIQELLVNKLSTCQIDQFTYELIKLIAVLFLYLLRAKNYKLSHKLFETFSKLLLIDFEKLKVNANNEENYYLNQVSALILDTALNSGLDEDKVDTDDYQTDVKENDFKITNEVAGNIVTFFNQFSTKHAELLDYSLKLLQHLIKISQNNFHMLSNVNLHLVTEHLYDTNLNYELKSIGLFIIGSLYENFKKERKMIIDEDEEDSNQVMSQKFVDFLFESIKNQILCENALLSIKNLFELNTKMIDIHVSPVIVDNILSLLSNDEAKNENEAKSNAIKNLSCGILGLIYKHNPYFLTKHALKIFEKLMLSNNIAILNQVLVTVRFIFEKLIITYNNEFDIISLIQNTKSQLIDYLVYNQQNQIFCLNIVYLLKLFVENESVIDKNIEFNIYELNNLSMQLEVNTNELIRSYCFDILKLIQLKQWDIPQNVQKLIEIETVSLEILSSDDDNDMQNISNLIVNLIENLFDVKIFTINLFEAINKLLNMSHRQRLKDVDNNLVAILTFLLIYSQNGHKLAKGLIDTLSQILIENIGRYSNDTKEVNEIIVQILYYIVVNGQLLSDNLVKVLNTFLVLPVVASAKQALVLPLCSTYAIKTYRLLASRNQILITDEIYDNIIKMLNDLRSENDELIVYLTEIIAYSIQNSSQLPKTANKLLSIVETNFQKNTSKVVKYYNCLALCAFAEHSRQFEDFTLSLLQLYAQGVCDCDHKTVERKTNATDNYTKLLNLRDISINTLETYLKNFKPDSSNNQAIMNMIEIRDIIDEEKFGNLISDNTKHVEEKINAIKQLYSSMNTEQTLDVIKVVSKFNLNALESCLNESNDLKLKLEILRIFELIACYLEQNQIDLVIKQLDNIQLVDIDIIQVIIKIVEKLVEFKKEIQNSNSIEILVKCIDNELIDKNLRFKLIDFLEILIKYQKIEPSILNQIKFEIECKKYRRVENLQNKQRSYDELLSYIFDGQSLSITSNAIETFEYLLNDKNSTLDIRNTILYAIELIIENKFQNNANENTKRLLKRLLNSFNELIRNVDSNGLDKSRLLNVFSLINEHTSDSLIDQKLMNNIEAKLLKNSENEIKFDSKIFDIILKTTQNGCKLTKATIMQLVKLLKKENLNIDQRIKVMKVFKNLAENFVQLSDYDQEEEEEEEGKDKEVVDYDKDVYARETILYHLEQQLSIENYQQLHQLTFNVLKYQYNYKPSSNFFKLMMNVLSNHPLQAQIEYFLKCSLNLPIQMFLHLMHVVFLSEYFTNIKLEDPTDEDKVKIVGLLCRDLLCRNLLAKINEYDKYDEVTEFKFYQNFTELEEFFGYKYYSIFRDEILIRLMDEINEKRSFTLNEINEVLLLLKTSDSALDILHSNANDWFMKLKVNWLNTVIFVKYKHIKSNRFETTIDSIKSTIIIDLLLDKLKFGVYLSECLLERICDLSDVNELIEFLTYLHLIHTNYDDFSLVDYLFNNIEKKIIIKNVQTWRYDIECSLIKKKFLKIMLFKRYLHVNNMNSIKLIKETELNLKKMYENNWSFETINVLLDKLRSIKTENFEILLEDLANTLNIINNFKINEYVMNTDGINAMSIIDIKDSTQWAISMHKFAVSVCFDQDEREKSLRNLIDEIKKNNENENNSKINQKIENLEQEYRNVIVVYNRDSQLYPIGKPINKWSSIDIKRWSLNYKSLSANKGFNCKYELICVIKRAIYLHNNKHQFEARSIQIISLLLMLDAAENNIARLAQIKTGEGKSVIIAMFAAYKALNGHKVDIVTTSPLLAKRDADNKITFYRMLNLTVGDNGGNSNKKPAYKCDVVYGDVNEYQFDILRDEYSLLGTRCGRPFDIAIVDEVDSMLIDDNSKICRLASKMPAMEELEVLLVTIWQELNRINERLVPVDGKLYCVTVPFKRDKNGQIILLKGETDKNNNQQSEEDDESDFIEIENRFEFVKDHLKNYVENKLLKPNEKNESLLKIPHHLRDFVKEQLEKWITNAWLAKFSYQENIDYLIAKCDSKGGQSCIMPIDYKNTGIIQTNTTWCDGLHQFLQIKHKLRITAENLTTNFLSNVEYFSRFKKNLFGLTGTLGSKEAKNLIKHIYDVDFVIVPPYKYTQFNAYPDRICYDIAEWMSDCTKAIYQEAKLNQRAVLCICETKSDADIIKNCLIEKDPMLKKQIKLYTRSDNDEKNAIDDELDVGQIIVATNLAGRGTDIVTTHKVEQNGGLHVLVTFLPLNTRVEQQNFGRTSRQGKRGTAQLIILEEKHKDMSVECLKETRDSQEKNNIQHAIKIELERIRLRDQLFERFCQLRKQLRQIDDDEYKLDSVEESWGFWLKTIFKHENDNDEDYKCIDIKELDKKFKEFSDYALNNFKTNKIFKNPFYLIKKANYFIFNKKKYDLAIDMLNDAINLDGVFSLNAYYNKAYALIKINAKNKNLAKLELLKAIKIINEALIPQYETIMIMFKVGTNQQSVASSDIEEQIMNKINILCLYKNQIERAIQVIEDAESKEHTVKIKFKKIDEFFSETNRPQKDIEEFKESGLLGFFELTRKEPTPWLSIIAVGLLGIAQAVAGAALIVFTSGAAVNIGMALLSEGVGDIIHAIKSGISGEFSWKDYAIQKAISVAITIATCGMSALKETGKAIKGGANLVKNLTVKGASKQIVGQFTKESWKLVGKKIGVEIAKAGAKKILITVLDKTLLAAISNKINSEISKNIENKILDEISNNKFINTLFGIDSSFRNSVFKNEIENIALKLLSPQNNKLLSAVVSIAKGILNELSDGVSSHLINIFNAGKCLTELATFLDDYLREFRKELISKLEEKAKIENLMHVYNSEKLNHKTAKEIVKILKCENYVDNDGIRVLKPVDKAVLVQQVHQQHQDYVVEVCNSLYNEANSNNEYKIQKNILTKTLTDAIASHMTSRINSELINPAVTTGVNALVNKVSDKIQAACANSQDTLQQQLEKHRSQREIMQYQKDMARQAAKQEAQKGERVVKEVDTKSKNQDFEKLARKAESNSEGGLVELGALSANLNKPIQVFKAGKYDFTIGDPSAGKPIRVNYKPGENGSIGHWENPDGHAIATGAKNCLYDAISAQTNIPSNELRQRTANYMRENAEHFNKMMPAIEKLSKNSNKGLLYIGGTNLQRQPPPRLGQNTTRGNINDLLNSLQYSFNNFESIQKPAASAMSNRYDFPVNQVKDTNGNIVYRDQVFNKEYTEADVQSAYQKFVQNQQNPQARLNPNMRITGMRFGFKEGLGQSNAANTVAVPIGRNQFNIEGLGVRKNGSIYRINYHVFSDTPGRATTRYYDNQGNYIKTNKPGLSIEDKKIAEDKMYQNVRRTVENNLRTAYQNQQQQQNNHF